jgi:hypothetical protein
MQNLPSTGSIYAKPIKRCFSAPTGWLLCSADFASLEDRISALTTKDSNKLRVYSGDTQFNLEINGVSHHILGTDVLEYDGQKLTGNQLYEKLTNSKP